MSDTPSAGLQVTSRDRPVRGRGMIVLFVALLMLLSNAIFYVGLASSTALGTIVAAGLLVFVRMDLLISQDFVRSPVARRATTPLTVTLVVFSIILLHAMVASMFLPFDFGHAAGSALLLVILVAGSCVFGEILQRTADEMIDAAMRTIFWLFLPVAALGIAGLEPPSPMVLPRPVFPFTEPSHLALNIFPFLFYCCVRSRGWKRYLYWGLGVLLAALLQNLTLIVLCLIAAAIIVRGLAIVPVVLAGAALVLFADVGYYAARLDFLSGGDTRNISALVYLQGWQLLLESFEQSHGWGLGFQQLGLHGTSVEAANTIFSLIQDTGNLFDGGFGLSKVVSEFGVFGLGLVLLYLVFCWRSFRVLRRVARGNEAASAQVFAHCVVVGYFVVVFVRGSGYFAASTLLLLSALWILFSRRTGIDGSHSQ
jgi:hypothetical protein